MPKKTTDPSKCSDCRAEADGLKPVVIRNTSDSSFSPINLGNGRNDSTTKLEDSVITTKEKIEDDCGNISPIIESVPQQFFKTELAIGGMTCSACIGAITRAVEEIPYVRSVDVSLLTNSATVVFDGKHHEADLVTIIEDTGFDCSILSTEQIIPQSEKIENRKSVIFTAPGMWRADYAIGGMTCSACTNSVTAAIQALPFVDSVTVNLISNSAIVIFEGQQNLAAITEAIEDSGFDATTDKIQQVGNPEYNPSQERIVFIQVDGMYCHHCPDKIIASLRSTYDNKIKIDSSSLSDTSPILKLRYIPILPRITIRHIIGTVSELDRNFKVSIYHPPTIEDRSRETLAKERKKILLRLALSVSAAIPAFIIGVVCMTIMEKKSSIRMFMMHPMWIGSISRAEWALFVIATPIYFFAADIFHRKAFKEIKALWRPGSTTPIIQRFTRFGSMNMLMSLGTTVAYFSSIAEMIIQGTHKSVHPLSMDPTGMDHKKSKSSVADMREQVQPEVSHNYFDSVVFLTMFLLIGRSIEAYTKQKTGDAVTALGKLRPSEAILLDREGDAARNVKVDMLEVGDNVLVPNGSSPPFDGIIVDGCARFDESSLTGESKAVEKEIGDAVFSGTVNKTTPVTVRLTSISGASMLDQIINVVREGQTKRAPVERAADMVTSHFVPFVVAIGILTWVVWLGIGLGHRLPERWIHGQSGGWPLWALRFAISVFVVACPCGIGLAAPTALFVGGGLAAKYGILAKGGGEAFQEASTLSCIVFDKTGTLTVGGEPSVVDYENVANADEGEFLSMIKRLEESSQHPIATAIVNFCTFRVKQKQNFVPSFVEEIAGKGLSGSFQVEDKGKVDMIIGNETLLGEKAVVIDQNSKVKLEGWKRCGQSVVLVAMRRGSDSDSDSDSDGDDNSQWELTAIFAVADALRKEARYTVEALQRRGIAVWMLSGDNEITARAIGAMVGIPKDQIIAGVLPEGKAEKIKYLQRTLPAPKGKKRALVAMVGDGINDSPALSNADVGIAIGSGSDVAISSAEFILISSDLRAIITLIDLSRAVFRRVLFNFGWALIYNLVAMPFAAGVFHAIKTKQNHHIVLDPVWASVAMALSSVSVVTSSLLLRTRLPLIGFKEKHNINQF